MLLRPLVSPTGIWNSLWFVESWDRSTTTKADLGSSKKDQEGLVKCKLDPFSTLMVQMEEKEVKISMRAVRSLNTLFDIIM